MTTLTEQIIQQIAEDQYSGRTTCIECGTQYFHKPLCQKGFGLSSDELFKRLKERAALLPKSNQNPTCKHCGSEPAVGTFWIAYHGYTGILVASPSCLKCGSDRRSDGGRPFGFIPGLVTTNTAVVQRRLAAVLNNEA